MKSWRIGFIVQELWKKDVKKRNSKGNDYEENLTQTKTIQERITTQKP
jgi:hypothetical protein